MYECIKINFILQTIRYRQLILKINLFGNDFTTINLCIFEPH